MAFCITDLDPGGAERALVQLVTRLDRSRWQPSVICLAPRGMLADELEQAEVPVTCLGARHSRNVGMVGRLFHQLRESKPALLQTFLFHANIAGRIAGRLARVPKIVSGIRVAERRSTTDFGPVSSLSSSANPRTSGGWIGRVTRGVEHA